MNKRTLVAGIAAVLITTAMFGWRYHQGCAAVQKPIGDLPSQENAATNKLLLIGDPSHQVVSYAPGIEIVPNLAQTELDAEVDRNVEAFDALVDRWEEPQATGVLVQQVEDFYCAFNKLPTELKEEEIIRALNLLPDENILLIGGILLDKQQPFEVLDAIVNDLLNREDEIKRPLLDAIHNDKNHPCWNDVNWIKEATTSVE